jgi:hypothetical protein
MNLKIASLIINDLRILRLQGFKARKRFRRILTLTLSPSNCFSPDDPHPASPPSPVPTGEGQSAGSGEGMIMSPATRHLSLQAACRAGALAMLVAFWFDGGLFKLATASVFWILLELSQVRNAECEVRNPPSQSYGATSAEAS